MTFKVMGIFGVLTSIWSYFTARYAVFFMTNGPPPHSTDGKPQFPTEEWFAEYGNQPMTRDEFALYDLIHILCFFSFVMSMMMMIIGKCSVKAAMVKKTKMVTKIIKCGKWSMLALFVIGLIATHHGHELGKIAKKYEKNHKNETMFMAEQEEPDDACTYGDKTSCEADAQCSWCTSGAVADACRTLA